MQLLLLVCGSCGQVDEQDRWGDMEDELLLKEASPVASPRPVVGSGCGGAGAMKGCGHVKVGHCQTTPPTARALTTN